MNTVIPAMLLKMVDFYEGSTSLIAHFLKVYAYAKTIGEAESLDKETQETLEMAAILHDIAIPYCEEKYHSSAGPLQEKESENLLHPFLAEFNLPASLQERLIFLVSHHHTYTNVDNLDYQILLEADFLVNADESNHSRESIDAMAQNVFKTPTGKRLLSSIYQKR